MTNHHESNLLLLVSLTGDETIKLYDLEPTTGALTLRTESNAHGPSGALYLHPNGRVLYDAHVLATTLASFAFDRAAGSFTLLNKVDTGIEVPAHLITDQAGRFFAFATAFTPGRGGSPVCCVSTRPGAGVLFLRRALV